MGVWLAGLRYKKQDRQLLCAFVLHDNCIVMTQ
jgi:hypothetical protein